MPNLSWGLCLINNELYQNILEVLINSVEICYMYNAIALFWGAKLVNLKYLQLNIIYNIIFVAIDTSFCDKQKSTNVLMTRKLNGKSLTF